MPDITPVPLLLVHYLLTSFATRGLLFSASIFVFLPTMSAVCLEMNHWSRRHTFPRSTQSLPELKKRRIGGLRDRSLAQQYVASRLGPSCTGKTTSIALSISLGATTFINILANSCTKRLSSSSHNTDRRSLRQNKWLLVIKSAKIMKYRSS